ncbi:class I SAM-dependent methyltransferase [Sphingomonas immobilis]|uniref:Class I SAM-dependent methyltransferase n=1 Tax=Sphingomonas immobilis TaxID=3063997 RepID=A0ABT8ZTM7_9SPHN|nr:hypothetical protein [Sphingomonas sp. CA1-15]MDO7840914.1 hypothetical protein [Sphingomonas sp. CA1-15]
MIDDVQVQRDYYARTAQDYDALHVTDDDEHSVALAAFCGLAGSREPASILDIGAGTGRAIQRLQGRWPNCRSYSIFDNLDQIRAKFSRVFVMNTHDLAGTDPRFGSAHAMIFALKA